MDSTRSVVEDLLLEMLERVSCMISDDQDSSQGLTQGASEDRRIKLIQLPSGTFVFSGEDIQSIRSTERVLGTFCGPAQTMTSHTRLAPPLRLASEEAHLLIAKRRARLVSVSTEERVSPDEKTRALDLFQRKLLEFSNRERYKEKLESLCLSRQNNAPKERPHPDAVPYNPTQYNPENAYTVQLVDDPFTVLVDDAQYLRSTNLESDLKFQVFSHLWERGNYVTGGANFAADFLLYEGDPSYYHAYACVYCLPQDGKLSALDIVRYCRIGSSVKKNIVIASVQKGQVNCMTLSWEA